MCVCVCACVRACVRACACVYAYLKTVTMHITLGPIATGSANNLSMFACNFKISQLSVFIVIKIKNDATIRILQLFL